jgi:hypothetical protein
MNNEEILSQIEQKKQEIAMAQQELQNRMQIRQMPQPETITQKAFRLFNSLTKPKHRPQYKVQQPNNFGEARIGESQISEDRNDEVNYFKKLLREKDIEIRKQRHMLTKVNIPKTYVKTDFMGNTNTLKIKPQKRIKLQRKFKW